MTVTRLTDQLDRIEVGGFQAHLWSAAPASSRSLATPRAASPCTCPSTACCSPRTFLMDRHTLATHRDRWVPDPTPTSARLSRLDPAESALYEDLVTDRLGESVRLEQERVDWAWVTDRLPY